jgi:uncharacterized membrane protein YagU involved in acid resistance
MLTKRLESLFLIPLSLHVALRILISTRSYRFLPLNSPVIGDAYYYFNIARNFVAGRGLTHDLAVPTNGFQPLYQFLLIPVFFFSGDPFRAINYSLILSILAYVITGFLLWRLLTRFFGSFPAICAVTLWISSPVVTKNVLNGMETSTFLCVSTGLLLYYFSRVRSVKPSQITLKSLTAIGCLAGLAYLARVDSILVLLIISADYLWLHRHDLIRFRTLRMSHSLLVALIVTGPWLYYSLSNFGSALPTSGDASRLIAESYGMRAPCFDISNFIYAITAGFGESDPVIGIGAIALSRLFAGKILLYLLLIPSLLSGIVLFAFNRLTRSTPASALSRLLTFYMLVHMLMYAIAMPVNWFYFRYFAFFSIVFCVAYTSIISRLIASFENRRKLVAIATIGFSLIMALTHVHYLGEIRTDPRTQWGIDWIKENTDPQRDKIGIFQAEILAYYIPNKFVNLDGKCDVRALEALKQNRSFDFIRQENISYIVDRSDVIYLLLFKRSGPISENAIRLIEEKELLGQTWQAYKVELTDDSDLSN